jgi:hypothetical protein
MCSTSLEKHAIGRRGVATRPFFIMAMNGKEAVKIIDDVVENAWLNLHEGDYNEDADELEEATKLTIVLSLEDYKEIMRASSKIKDMASEVGYKI